MVDHRLSLCMIVRDEQEHLPRCLASVQGVVDEIVIVDTGSQDQSMAIAQSHGAVLATLPWTHNFAAARNESLRLASGDWILVLDADEVLVPPHSDLMVRLMAAEHVAGYFVQVHNLIGSKVDPQTEVTSGFRLFRNRPAYRFVGEVHEQVLPAIVEATPDAELVHSEIQVIHYGYLRETVASKGKQNRNLELLESRLAHDPSDPYVRFNVGLEHLLQGHFLKAHGAFQRALASAPRDAAWRPKLVKCHAATLCELGRWHRALTFLEEESARYPAYTDLQFMVGVAYSHLQEHGEAVRSFAACLRMGPAPCPPYTAVDPDMGMSRAYFALGKEYEALGQRPEAMQAYAKAAITKGGWIEPLQALTLLLGDKVSDDQAATFLERFFPRATREDQVVVASLLANAGRHQAALTRLAPVEKDGNSAAAYLETLCLAKVGRWAEALLRCEAGWEGEAWVKGGRALTLYCRVRLGEPPFEWQPDRQGLGALYADLALILADEPPAVVEQFLAQLPKPKLLARSLRR